jgi:hypothetical protein
MLGFVDETMMRMRKSAMEKEKIAISREGPRSTG